MLPRSGEGSTSRLGHGANRDLCDCGSTGPSRRDRLRARDVLWRSSSSGGPTAPSARGARTSRPRAACRSASDPLAAPAVQARAVSCLVNWARTHDRRSRLVRRTALQRAAALKGERVASCGQFSHTPCGSAVTAAVQAAGYRYATFGENLFAGTRGRVSARDVVSAWLQSPPHRANLLDRELPRRRRRAGPARTGCWTPATRSSGPRRSAPAASSAGLGRPAVNERPWATRATSTRCDPRFAVTSSAWPSGAGSRS